MVFIANDIGVNVACACVRTSISGTQRRRVTVSKRMLNVGCVAGYSQVAATVTVSYEGVLLIAIVISCVHLFRGS